LSRASADCSGSFVTVVSSCRTLARNKQHTGRLDFTAPAFGNVGGAGPFPPWTRAAMYGEMAPDGGVDPDFAAFSATQRHQRFASRKRFASANRGEIFMKTRMIAVLVAAALGAACTTDPYTGQQKMSNTAGGALLGAAAGAGLGLLAGGNDRRNALIGAGVGALAGGAVGAYMDNQEAQLRAQLQGTGVSVTREGNRIILNMPSNITFPTDQDAVLPAFYPTLNSVALVLRKYNQTLIDVNGHTDSTGSEQYNLDLSRRRAQSVASYLSAQGVDGRRFAINGFGKSDPIASNATEAGRAQNRRVEIYLTPIT
jgi:outer membrane protein OmpA-like peptidoglycan-associated protein